uniref:Transposon Ty3-G Gag-Pol polyprotein n=1 Tax=Cajanus cajan TaxID=3821 RepID=A0A151TF76_CAJCA|nr:Transposon Ty3-G Gag-Pol polyprotein [Cajanus cajan]
MEAFKKLQEALTTAPMLALPDFRATFDIETDAFSTIVGAILLQSGHPIAYFSKKLCSKLQVASAYARKMYAITESIKKWRQYLIGHHFRIFTDQQSLRHMFSQVFQTPEKPDQQKWAAKLQGFSYEILYKPGKQNRVTDALSRVPDTDIVEQLKNFFSTHANGLALVRQLSSVTHATPHFTVSHGLVYFKNRLFIPEIPSLRSSILHEFHASPMAGHSGVKATLARLAASFAWPTMAKDVKAFVRSCSTCQHNKSVASKKQGLLQPLPIPAKVWNDISMDFLTHLSSSVGHTVIWVVVDRLSKYAHFIALPTHFNASSLASQFMIEIVRLHGFPRTIVSNRDKVFLSSFWRELFRLHGTKLCFSSAYHPKIDGQTEVVNRVLTAYLRCFAGDFPRHWYLFLHLAEFWYNTTLQSALGMTPFQALYGRAPPAFPDFVSPPTTVVSVASLLQQKKMIMHVVRNNLRHARQRMVAQANKSRKDITFNPSDAAVHPIFHVSLLRQFHGEPPRAIATLHGETPEASLELSLSSPTHDANNNATQSDFPLQGSTSAHPEDSISTQPLDQSSIRGPQPLTAFVPFTKNTTATSDSHLDFEDEVIFQGAGNDISPLRRTRDRRPPFWLKDYKV